MGGSERGTWAAPPPRRVLVPYGSQAPSAPVLEVWKKAASPGTDPPKRASRRSAGSLSEATAQGGHSHFLCLTPAPQATHL